MLDVYRSDDELLALIKQDDEQAFKALYDRHWYNIYVIALQKLQRKDIAEELAQDLFLTIWNKRQTLQISNFKAFIISSIKNAVIDYIRKNIHESKYLAHLKQFVTLEQSSTHEAVNYNELKDAMYTSLAKLPEKTREIYLLNRFEDLTIREIAKRLNLSEKTIEYHLSRSTHFLRSDLKEFHSLCPIFLLFFL
jgi:RNA polymerase sigma-70 factor (family 1)